MPEGQVAVVEVSWKNEGKLCALPSLHSNSVFQCITTCTVSRLAVGLTCMDKTPLLLLPERVEVRTAPTPLFKLYCARNTAREMGTCV